MELAETVTTPVPSSRETSPTEEDGMLREDGVREVLARLQRGERIKAIARALGVARNTVKRWQRLGAGVHARRDTALVRPIPGPEVNWNGRVLHRELQALGFAGTYQQVQRAIQPLRVDRAWRPWRPCGLRRTRASKRK